MGTLTTDFTYGTSVNATTFLDDGLWNIVLGGGMNHNANGTLGTVGFFGQNPRSDIRAIVINSSGSSAKKGDLSELSRFYNSVPVYNTIRNSTYLVQGSKVSGVFSCKVYSGTDGGYCN